MKIELYYNGKWNKFEFEDFGKKDFDELIGYDGRVEDFGADDSTLYKLLQGLETTYQVYEGLRVLNELYNEYNYLFDNESELFDVVYVILSNEYYGLGDLIGKKGEEMVEYLKQYFENGVWVEPVRGRTPEKVLGQFVLDEVMEVYEGLEVFDLLEPYIDKKEFVDVLFEDFEEDLVEHGYIDEEDVKKKDYNKMYDALLDYFTDGGFMMMKEEFAAFVDVEDFGRDVLYAGDSYKINTKPTPNGRYVIWRVL